MIIQEDAMGLTVLEIEVANPASPGTTEKVEFLVDSGAIYSIVPTPILARLDIRPLAVQEFRLANGEKITRKKGVAVFKYGERIGGADVVFGEEGDAVLLGAFTLEALGLALDPLRRELKALPMLLARTEPGRPGLQEPPRESTGDRSKGS
jgi:predicted aspartyl protease